MGSLEQAVIVLRFQRPGCRPKEKSGCGRVPVKGKELFQPSLVTSEALVPLQDLIN
jgi:hypothetical protein